ncbi:MAG: 2Fe-2S iron-sulfur cluster-binding protein [Pseudomonadales bacterium]|nr:2Fe-2S iron-sulfur cluster-binding protein [Pseudomonadales bacterium]
MASITFIEHDGTEHKVEVEEGQSLMEAAQVGDVPGIDADCGGCCGCGTCHIIVDPAWASKTGSMADDEKLMLDMTPEKTSTSRLSCQVIASEDMDGMIVRLPEFQM